MMHTRDASSNESLSLRALPLINRACINPESTMNGINPATTNASFHPYENAIARAVMIADNPLTITPI